jgi:hypothetical protein
MEREIADPDYVESLTDTTAAPGDTGAPPAGHRLRYMVFVPEPKTTMIMGDRLLDGDVAPTAGPLGYPGFSVLTNENVFVDVRKKTMFQGHDAVVVQTLSDWTQYSTGKTSHYAYENMELTAAGGVIIGSVSNLGPGGADIQPTSGDAVPGVRSYDGLRTALLASHATGFNAARITWGAFDTLRNVLGFTPSQSSSTFKTVVGSGFAALPALGALGGEVINIIEAVDPPSVGIQLTSNDKIAVSTSQRVQSYAGGGFEFMGGFATDGWGATPDPKHPDASGATLPGSVFNVNVTRTVAIEALLSAELFSVASTTVDAGYKVDVNAIGPVTVASRMDETVLMGQTITLGKNVPAPALINIGLNPMNQRATQTLTVEATDAIKIGPKPTKSIEIGTSGQGAWEPNNITNELWAYAKQTTVMCQNYALRISEDDSRIELNRGTSQYVRIQNNVVTVKSGDYSVEVTDSSVSLKGPNNNNLVINSSGLRFRGKQFKFEP